MNREYALDYLNENDFKKKERNLKKYNMLAYKKLYFDYYPSLRNGEFKGELVKENKKDNSKMYELKLPTDTMFAKVHGDIVVHYTVYENEKTIVLTKITPDDVLSEEHKTEILTYKGVMISKENREKDMFKINLLNMINRD